MQRDRRRIRILDEPLEGQGPQADGEFLVGEVYHVMRKGYVLNVCYLKRETNHFEGRSSWVSESFMLFSSSKSVLVIQNPGPYSKGKLEQAARAAAMHLEGLKAEVLAMREENNARRERERAAAGVRA